MVFLCVQIAVFITHIDEIKMYSQFVEQGLNFLKEAGGFPFILLPIELGKFRKCGSDEPSLS
jgi:hypothetical protein